MKKIGLKILKIPIVELHIRNIYNREEFRKQSLLSPNCKAVICGLGLDSYKAALSSLKTWSYKKTTTYITLLAFDWVWAGW